MALSRFAQCTDGTIPIVALLYGDEQLLGSQDSIGIYDGQQKSPRHQSGTVSITSHRLFYIDSTHPSSQSFTVDLACVSRTDYHAGLFTSSPKITVYFSAAERSTADSSTSSLGSWECQVCAYRNPPGLSPSAVRICGLCGVPRDAMSNEEDPPQESSSLLHSPDRRFGRSTSLTDQPEPTPCPACTFLNHPSLRTCELCDSVLTPSLSSSGPAGGYRRGMKSAPVSRLHSPGADADDDSASMMKISFRKGGDKPIYAILKRSLKSKAWEATPTDAANKSVGISGILQTVETSAQGRNSNLQDALQDLEALKIKAKDMVSLAAELNEKLTAASAQSSSTAVQGDDEYYSLSPSRSGTTLVVHSEPEEATFIRSSLTQLGLHMDHAPVTLDMIKDERKWYDELARELARVLQGNSPPSSQSTWGLMRDRGIVALDEVWGGWNRARGVALIPPSTFLQTLPLLPYHTSPPIQKRVFPSGLTVLHTPPYQRAAFSARLSGFLAISGNGQGRTTAEVSMEEGMGVALAREMVEASEADGDVCRDEGGGAVGEEVRWWPNLFLGYVWDGQV